MRVGIITIWDISNYGNRLQNYATQMVLNNLGVEAETIRNTSGPRESFLKEKSRNLFGEVYNKLKFLNCEKLNYSARTCNFNHFNKKYIKKSKFIIDIKKLPKELDEYYDYFLCGSDQIWNPNSVFSTELDFLSFAIKEKRIAYSPSFGVDKLKDDISKEYTKLINGIPNLSIREESGKKIIKELTGREAEVLLDPTMMLSKLEWEKICKKPEFKIGKKYIVKYFLGNNQKKINDEIDKIAYENKFEIIDLCNRKLKEYYCCNPSEFLWLINNSELICTDSFHGTVFSIIMQKPFIVYQRIDSNVSMNTRIENLLKKFNMENRVNSLITKDNLFNIDFSESLNILEKEKNKSLIFLKKSLNIK